MSKGLGQKIGIRFTQKITSFTAAGFTISWQERKHIAGPLVNKSFNIASIEQVDDYTLRLTMGGQQRFNNTEGGVTVTYDATVGGLQGRGGAVASFSVIFSPTELIPKLNPHQAEQISVGATAAVGFTKVTYNNAYAQEQIAVSATATVDFIYVGVVNP